MRTNNPLCIGEKRSNNQQQQFWPNNRTFSYWCYAGLESSHTLNLKNLYIIETGKQLICWLFHESQKFIWCILVALWVKEKECVFEVHGKRLLLDFNGGYIYLCIVYSLLGYLMFFKCKHYITKIPSIISIILNLMISNFNSIHHSAKCCLCWSS